MYSRKYVRSSGVLSPVERIGSTAGEGAYPSTPTIQTAERSIPLPPDYTGTAFSSGEKGSSLQSPTDYPETRISPFAQEANAPEEEHPAPLPSIEDEAAELTSSPTVAELIPDEESHPPLTAEYSMEDTLDSAPVQGTEPPTIPLREAAESADQASASPPLLTADLLRSLTLEDLLLIWMLLLLMVSNQEEQIYLLLGLLLFNR